jgi:hypothetical protein
MGRERVVNWMRGNRETRATGSKGAREGGICCSGKMVLM